MASRLSVPNFYTYDDPLVPFSLGRLTRIARAAGQVNCEIQSVNVYGCRSFLWRSIQQKKDAMGVVHPTTVRSRYSSKSILHWLEKSSSDGTESIKSCRD